MDTFPQSMLKRLFQSHGLQAFTSTLRGDWKEFAAHSR